MKEVNIKEIYDNKDDAISFIVKDGYKKFKESRGKLKNDYYKKIISLDNIPLVMLSEEETAVNSAIIKTMGGRSFVREEIREKININQPIKNLQKGFIALKPFLTLLEDGKYELKEFEMIPTDGEDNFFWNLGRVGRYYSASADVYNNGEYIKGFPKFLVPSEGIECFDREKVEHYRKEIREGKELVGIAFELRGFMALLLDGHNKAAAAYLEGCNLKCLMIRSCDNNCDVLNVQKDRYKECISEAAKKIEIESPKAVFPDYKAIALVDKTIDISKKRIEKLLNFESNQPIEELEKIICYLSIYNKEKAKELCSEILKRNDLQIMWKHCIKYLAKYKESKVKLLFESIRDDKNIRYSTNYEISLNIISRYLESYSN